MHKTSNVRENPNDLILRNDTLVLRFVSIFENNLSFLYVKKKIIFAPQCYMNFYNYVHLYRLLFMKYISF